MELLKFSDQMLVEFTDKLRLRELFALFCTCKRLRDLSRKTDFWKRRGFIRYGEVYDKGEWKMCRDWVVWNHYLNQIDVLPLSARDFWRNWEWNALVTTRVWVDMKAVSIARTIVVLATKEQAAGLKVRLCEDWQWLYPSFAVANPWVIVKYTEALLSEPRSFKYMMQMLTLTHTIRRRVKRWIMKYMIGKRELFNSKVNRAICDATPIKIINGFASLSPIEHYPWTVDDVVHLLNMIDTLQRFDKMQSRIMSSRIQGNYGQFGHNFQLHDFRPSWEMLETVYYGLAKQIKLN